MIINTGQRTDIPAFYAEWFANRLREGLVCVRNPKRVEGAAKAAEITLTRGEWYALYKAAGNQLP